MPQPPTPSPSAPVARALVTGGASGIGRALAAALAAQGTEVIIVDLDAGRAQAAAEAIGGVAIACDVSDPAAVRAMLATSWEAVGPVDLICSNAGVGRNRRLIRETPEEMAALMAVNLAPALTIAQAYLERLEATPGAQGRLMFTASENSLSLPPAVRGFGLGAYGATKHGLLILAEWMRAEFAERPIKLHVLCPGPVYTELMHAAIPDPNAAPKDFHLISPEMCAAIALRGLQLDLFYIPTHRHILSDMTIRLSEIQQAAEALDIA